MLSPKVDFVIHEFKYDNKPIVLFEIDPVRNQPVNFKGEGYIRVGDSKRRLRNYPEKERKIWKGEAAFDWSAQICKNATMDNLDPQAIHKARYLYKQKYPRLEKDIDKWDDIEFLNKARITRQSKITNSAIILLGKEESEHFISPSVAKICWILKDQDNIEKDYEHFGPPFLLNVDRLFRRLRNLKYRYLPDNTLFPIEINQYDPWVIREALHNCIAHQDYTLNGRINIIEVEDELIFSNLGSFIPGSVEAVIQSDAPPEFYRNYFLTQAMFNLDLIDTIGSGIRRMFQKQKGRFFPLPDYDLTLPEKVIVKIQGKILDENYTRLLIERTDFNLGTVILLDKVQKRIKLSKDEHNFLKSKNLVEGRYPNLLVSSRIASITEKRTSYIKGRAFDNQYYIDLLFEYLKQYKSASREDINNLLLDKLPNILTEEQRLTKIKNMLYNMSKKRKLIKNVGGRKYPTWVLLDSEGKKL